LDHSLQNELRRFAFFDEFKDDSHLASGADGVRAEHHG